MATMTRTKRTDIHRPSADEFDPSEYDCRGVYYFGNKGFHLSHSENALKDMLNTLEAEGFYFAAKDRHHCGHCGTYISYGALMIHVDSGHYIFVGETCLDNRFSIATASEFQRLRREAKLGRDRLKRVERETKRALGREANKNYFLVNNPDLAILTYPEVFSSNTSYSFMQSISYALTTYGGLTDNQTNAVRNWLIRELVNLNTPPAPPALPVPTGTVEIEGIVTGSKFVDNPYGYDVTVTRKITVTTDDGWKVYVTCPRSIVDVEKGQRVNLTATVVASDDDETFGFGSRPKKASIL